MDPYKPPTVVDDPPPPRRSRFPGRYVAFAGVIILIGGLLFAVLGGLGILEVLIVLFVAGLLVAAGARRQ